MKKHNRVKSCIVIATLILSLNSTNAHGQSSFRENEVAKSAAPQRAISNSEEYVDEIGLEYTDREVAQLLLAGQGRIAEEKPELVKILGFSEQKPETDMVKLNLMLDEYLAETPDFHERVAVPFQSGNPQKVDRALIHISETFLNYANARQQIFTADQAALQGWLWMGAYVAIYANIVGLANAVGYANVAVATLAVATIGIVTWYLPEGAGGASKIDREERIAKMTKILNDGNDT